MTWQFSSISSAHFFTAMIALVVGGMVWRQRRQAGTWALALLMLAVAQWSLAAGLEAAAVGQAAKILCSKIAYVGETTSTTFLLFFILEYTHQDRWLTRRMRYLLWIGPLLITALTWTNEWHHLIWTGFSPGPSGSNILIYHHGSAFWAAVAYFYTVGIVCCGLLVRSARRAQEPYRQQVAWLLLSIGVPFIGGAVYLLWPAALPGLDTTPISFSIVGLLLAWNILHNQLFDLTPVAYEAVFANVEEGIVALDERNRVVNINPAAERILGLARQTVTGLPWDRVSPISDLGSAISDLRPPTALRTDISLDWGQQPPVYLDLSVLPLYDRDRQTGRLIVFRDITERKRLESDLQAMNAALERLVIERTRQLQATVDELEGEIRERRKVEEVLRRTEETLAQRVADQSHKLTALYEVILMSGQQLDVEALLQQTLVKITAAVGGDAVCIHQVDENGSLHLSVHQGLSETAQQQILTVPGAWLLDTGIPRVVADVHADPTLPSAVRLPDLGAYLGAPVFLHGKAIGALSMFWIEPHPLPVEDIALFSVMADQVGALIENVRLRQRSEEAAVLRERQRLARDLHDSVTQSLHSLVWLTDVARDRLQQENYGRLESALAQLTESARQALKEMRLLLYELRPLSLEQTSLAEALRLRLEMVEGRAGIEAQISADEARRWPAAWEAEVFAIALEALNNALKHARASRVTITLRGGAEWIAMEVTDNGRGFDLQRRTGGMGLRTMAERAEQIGGTLTIDSAPGEGTRVHLQVGGTE